jgi:hypothetical protein
MPNLIRMAALRAVMTDHQSIESLGRSCIGPSGFFDGLSRLVIGPPDGGTGPLLRHQCAEKRAAKTGYLGSERSDVGAIHAHGYGTEPDQAQTRHLVNSGIPGGHYSDCKGCRETGGLIG